VFQRQANAWRYRESFELDLKLQKPWFGLWQPPLRHDKIKALGVDMRKISF